MTMPLDWIDVHLAAGQGGICRTNLGRWSNLERLRRRCDRGGGNKTRHSQTLPFLYLHVSAQVYLIGLIEGEELTEAQQGRVRN
jgi:hypothetical protein